MYSEEPPTRHFPGCIGDKPEERRHHNVWLDQLGAIEARFIGDHRGVGHAAGDQHVDGDAGAVQVLRHDRAASAALEARRSGSREHHPKGGVSIDRCSDQITVA
jgi:hypothetical protein